MDRPHKPDATEPDKGTPYDAGRPPSTALESTGGRATPKWNSDSSGYRAKQPSSSENADFVAEHLRQAQLFDLEETLTEPNFEQGGDAEPALSAAETWNMGSGDLIGPIRLIRRIGTGMSATVWLAEDQNLKTTVALKILRRRLTNPQKTDNFLSEARLAAGLNHRNIVRVHTCGEYMGCYYIEMEHIDGVDLQRLVSRFERLPVAAAMEAVLCASIGLGHAHRRGLLHRDVKPANIMVTQTGQVKLTDFGMAEILPDPSVDLDGHHLRVCGSPVFMAPELISKKTPPSGATDIYALGVTLFRLVTGRYPFQGKTIQETLGLHAAKPIPKMSDLVECPEGLDSIVARMLQKDPAERYDDCRRIFIDVLTCLGSVGGSTLEESWSEGYFSVELGRLCNELLGET